MTKSINVVFIRQNRRVNEGTVYIRTIENRVIKKKSLQIRIQKNHWESYFNPVTQRFRNDERFPNHSFFNYKIENSLSELQRHDNDIESLPDNKKSFLKYWKESIENTDNHGTVIKHNTIIHKLENYLTSIDKGDLLFKDITPLFLRGFKSYLGTVNDPKILSVNSVNHYLKVMKSIINQSIVDEYYSYTKHPFSSLKFSNEKVKKNILNDTEFTSLLNTEITNVDSNITRDMFLFQVFSNGMRVSDLFLLRWNNFVNRRLDYKMFKTGNDLSIPVNINMVIILSKILSVFDKYKQCCDSFTIEFKNEFTVLPIPFVGITIHELDVIISFLDYDKVPGNERLYSSMKLNTMKLVNRTREKMGDIITYKGYKVGTNDEKLKRVIDTREALMNKINNYFIDYVLTKIQTLKRGHLTEFVFPVLNNNLFRNIGNNNNFSNLSLEQYKSIKHHTIVYNRKLKNVQKLCEIKTNISSHVSRHTFTNLLLRMEDVNLYDISQSLGHSSIKITENYLTSGFNVEKIDYINKKVSTKFRVQ